MRDPSPYAGRTVRLRADAAELGGHQAEVVDWYENTGPHQPWASMIDADPRAQGYTIRRALAGLPGDDDVLFARVDGLGQLIHVSEIEGADPAPPPAGRRPQKVHPGEIGQPCLACGQPLQEGDMVAPVPLGPGDDLQARTDARAGRPFKAKMVDLHWACVTGDESYETAGV